MSDALNRLTDRVNAIDDRDDLLVALVIELRELAANLRAQLASLPNVDAELNALADRLDVSVAKLDGALTPPAEDPAPDPAPAPEPTPEPEPVPAPEPDPVPVTDVVTEPTPEPAPEPAPAPAPEQP